jgi:hypothetical protein
MTSPLKARNGSGFSSSYSTVPHAAHAVRMGLKGFSYASYPGGNYTDETLLNWDASIASATGGHSYNITPQLYLYLAWGESGSCAKTSPSPSLYPAHSRIDASLSVSPSPVTMSGTWEPSSYMDISQYTSAILDTDLDWDGGDGVSFNWFQQWDTEDVANTGEDGTVTVTKTGTSTRDVYLHIASGLYVFHPEGYYATYGDISGHTYIGEEDFTYSATVVYSNDYLVSTFYDDAADLWEELKTASEGFLKTEPVFLLWNDDKTGVVDYPAVDVPDWFVNIGLDEWVDMPTFLVYGGGAGFSRSVASSTIPRDGAISFAGARITYRGSLALFTAEYTHTDTEPTSNITVTDRRSELQPWGGDDALAVQPTDDEVDALLASMEGVLKTVGYASQYTASTPDFPVPSYP